MFKKLDIPGLILVEPAQHLDQRGYFSETYNWERFLKSGINCNFVQDNQSFNLSKNTIRGLHFQSPPFAQDKLVRVGQGAVMDIAVDIRKKSKFFGKYFKIILSSKNRKQLFIPKGFLHGFITLEDNTELLYKCTNFYAPEFDNTIKYNDTLLNIDWGVEDNSIKISDKDLNGLSFNRLISPF